MKNLRLTCVFLSYLAICTGLQRAHGDDVAPGKSSNKNGIETWTREGDLGPLPKHKSSLLPLSDQENQGDWLIYQPQTDEFEGKELNQEKWSPRHRSWRGRKPAWFSQDNVKVVQGQLQLSMRKQEPPSKLRSKGFHTYSSAAVQAREMVKYGYFEVRAQPMNSAGSSSFWFAGYDENYRTEIDVFELGGKAKGHEQRYNMNLHVFSSPKSDKHWNIGGHWIAPWRFADAFHIYGLDWNEKEITYFIDGVAVRRVQNTDWHQPLFLIFDSETMPDWLGLPVDEDLPSTYKIDYVRSWKSQKHKVANKGDEIKAITQ